MRAPILFTIVMAIHGTAITGFFLMQGCATRPPRVPVSRTENVQLPPSTSHTVTTHQGDVNTRPLADVRADQASGTVTSTTTGRSFKMPPPRSAATAAQVKPMTNVPRGPGTEVTYASGVTSKPYTPKLGSGVATAAGTTAAAGSAVAGRRSSTDTSGATVYKVKKGDMLSKIAYQNGISSKELAEYNNLTNANAIRVDQKLLIPPYARAKQSSDTSRPTSATVSKGSSAVGSAGASTYVVKKGDHLTGIARKHGVTISALRAANNMKNDNIYAGKSIVIPKGGSVKAADTAKKPATYTPTTINTPVHPVQKPATVVNKPAVGGMQKIEEIAVGSKNNVKDTTLINSGLGRPASGAPQVVKHPPIVIPPTVVTPAPTPAPAPSALEQAFEYVVQDDETLEDIARAFIVSADDVRKLNALAPKAAVKPGQTLKIPPSIF
ncbi:MAG: LysM repeat protein [Candidatus Omnitrophota bacterium]|jgi:LysM repeat protein